MPRTKIDYSKSVIYKIVCRNPEIKGYYVGSTTNLTNRRNQHKITCNNEGKKGDCYKYEFIRENGGWDNWDVVKIEDYECDNKEDLHKRERYWIENLEASLNQAIPTRTHKEYRVDNRDKFLNIQKIYRDNHKEEIHKRHGEKTECGCGGRYRRDHKGRHMKSKKHTEWVKTL